MPGIIQTVTLAVAYLLGGTNAQRVPLPDLVYTTPQDSPACTALYFSCTKCDCVLMKNPARLDVEALVKYRMPPIVGNPLLTCYTLALNESTPASNGDLRYPMKGVHSIRSSDVPHGTTITALHGKTQAYVVPHNRHSKCWGYTAALKVRNALLKDSNTVSVSSCNTVCTVQPTPKNELHISCQERQPTCPVNSNKLARWKASPRQAKKRRF